MARKAGRKPIVLTPEVMELLGKRRDREVAAIAGVSVATIFKLRVARGIPSYKSTYLKAKPPEPKHPPIDATTISLLGTMSDTELSNISGFSAKRLARAREAQKIPQLKGKRGRQSPVTPDVLALLGTMTDKELAVKSGLSISAIRYARKNRGIKSKGRWGQGYPKVKEIPDEAIALLGKKTDAAIGRLFGISRDRILKARRKRGIPTFRTDREEEQPATDSSAL